MVGITRSKVIWFYIGPTVGISSSQVKRCDHYGMSQGDRWHYIYKTSSYAYEAGIPPLQSSAASAWPGPCKSTAADGGGRVGWGAFSGLHWSLNFFRFWSAVKPGDATAGGDFGTSAFMISMGCVSKLSACPRTGVGNARSFPGKRDKPTWVIMIHHDSSCFEISSTISIWYVISSVQFTVTKGEHKKWNKLQLRCNDGIAQSSGYDFSFQFHLLVYNFNLFWTSYQTLRFL